MSRGHAVPAAIEPTGLQSRSQRALHTLLVAAGWALFVWAWWDVTRNPTSVVDLQRLVLGAIVAAPAITLWWVLHNLDLYKRLGPRRGARAVPLEYKADFNGRPVRAHWPTLGAARLVEIDIDELGFKCYTARAGEPDATPPAPRDDGADRGARAAAIA